MPSPIPRGGDDDNDGTWGLLGVVIGGLVGGAGILGALVYYRLHVALKNKEATQLLPGKCAHVYVCVCV